MDRPGAPGTWRPAATATLLAAALYRIRFGYAFGYGDQDEFLPWLAHRLDPTVLSSDWLVGLQSAGFNVRSGFMAVLYPLAAQIGTDSAVALLYGVAWVLLGLGVHSFAYSLGRSAAAAVATTVLVLVVVPRWTLGGNALAASMLVPSMLAWGLCWAALAIHARGSSVAGGTLIGLAAWIQPLVAFAAAVPATAAAAAGRLSRGDGAAQAVRSAVSTLVPVGLVALPVFLLLALDRPPPPEDGPGFVHLLTRLRAPHHYLTGAFPVADRLQFLALAVAGSAGLGFLLRNTDATRVHYAAGLLAGSAVLMGAGLVGMAVPLVALVQPFKVTVLAAVVLVALASAAAVRGLSHRAPSVGTALDRVAAHGALTAASAALLVAATVGIPERTAPDGAMAAAADWLRDHAPSDAVVAVPPSATGFRYRSAHAVVVTFKAVPFTPADLAAWYRRLNDVAPGYEPTDPPLDVAVTLDSLDAAYERMRPADIDRLVQRHSVSWVVRRTPPPPDVRSLDLAFRSGPVSVYRHVPRDRP